MLPDEQIKKIQEVWEKHFGYPISDEEADVQGSRLVRIVRLICEPTAIDTNKDAQKSDENLNKNNK